MWYFDDLSFQVWHMLCWLQSLLDMVSILLFSPSWHTFSWEHQGTSQLVTACVQVTVNYLLQSNDPLQTFIFHTIELLSETNWLWWILILVDLGKLRLIFSLYRQLCIIANFSYAPAFCFNLCWSLNLLFGYALCKKWQDQGLSRQYEWQTFCVSAKAQDG